MYNLQFDCLLGCPPVTGVEDEHVGPCPRLGQPVGRVDTNRLFDFRRRVRGRMADHHEERGSKVFDREIEFVEFDGEEALMLVDGFAIRFVHARLVLHSCGEHAHHRLPVVPAD